MSQSLVQAMGQLVARDEQGRTALIVAAQHGMSGLASILLKNGSDPNDFDENRDTALFIAIAEHPRRVALIMALLEAGADVRAANNVGDTPLHAAALVANDAWCRALIDRGARVDTKNVAGQTPIDYIFDHDLRLKIEAYGRSKQALQQTTAAGRDRTAN